MARQQFKIEKTEDRLFARDWIRNQFQGYNFPYGYQVNNDSTAKNIKAEEKFKAIGRESEEINNWCEEHLDKDQWKKLKNAIRSSRLRKRRSFGSSESITRIDIKHRSYYMLKCLATHHGVTLSEVIEIYMKDAWMELPEEED